MCLLFTQGFALSTYWWHPLSHHVVCEDALCPRKRLDFTHKEETSAWGIKIVQRWQTSERGSLVRINSCGHHYNPLAIINTNPSSSPGVTSSGVTHTYSHHQRGPTPASYVEQNPIKTSFQLNKKNTASEKFSANTTRYPRDYLKHFPFLDCKPKAEISLL